MYFSNKKQKGNECAKKKLGIYLVRKEYKTIKTIISILLFAPAIVMRSGSQWEFKVNHYFRNKS